MADETTEKVRQALEAAIKALGPAPVAPSPPPAPVAPAAPTAPTPPADSEITEMFGKINSMHPKTHNWIKCDGCRDAFVKAGRKAGLKVSDNGDEITIEPKDEEEEEEK